MIVRLAYHDSRVRTCQYHYDSPPPGSPALGEVTDSRDSRDMGCAVCDATRRAEHLLEEGLHVAPKDRGQIVVRARDGEGRVVLVWDRSDNALSIRWHGSDHWQHADRGELHPAHVGLLNSLI